MGTIKSLAQLCILLIVAMTMCLTVSLLLSSLVSDKSVRALLYQGFEWLGASLEHKLIVLLLPGSILGWVCVFTGLHRHFQSARSATRAKGAESSADVK